MVKVWWQIEIKRVKGLERNEEKNNQQQHDTQMRSNLKTHKINDTIKLLDAENEMNKKNVIWLFSRESFIVRSVIIMTTAEFDFVSFPFHKSTFRTSIIG